MVSRVKNEADSVCTPSYAGREMNTPVPKFSLPASSMSAQTAYRLIHDELMLDGNSRLNLATFVTTWMEPEAEALMSETFDKNMIDKDEYPQTARIEERCINMVSNLFHAPESGVGTSAIGSSEAVMLAGMALKWNWRDRMKTKGKPVDKPNLVMGSNVQVVWEKFCRYWEVEPRYIPMEEGRFVIDTESVINTVDENTIGVVAILGTTYTGEFEPVEAIHDALVAYNKDNGYDIPLHVDAASGGFVAPFIHQKMKWDFRLPQVKSINVSGHKYGLVYPGVGWIIWRDADELPEDLIFHVNYLGGDMPTFTLNFSRPGNQVIAQYYNFIRLGFEGYRRIMLSLQQISMHIAEAISELEHFHIINNGSTIPVIAVSINAEQAGFDEYAISDALRVYGWQVPAYTMPENIQNMSVLRMVIREGFSMDMADALINDFKRAIEYCAGKKENQSMFSH
ncbi:glutamate decarboxylase [Endozoicomonas sp. OPT23]|uniref:glutamate decarboxylase n=1 Tax=Endozoicomonas sp. OPT23 TaxID=2072845 RepID=UPI00129B519B|nr:glutamate decarboxylase [Endozoicomonas sp. OPT23]MRI31659.1 glutamate decarboxylase [Endozoicomonas sp. OPT23]